jgi:hypothetical protein
MHPRWIIDPNIDVRAGYRDRNDVDGFEADMLNADDLIIPSKSLCSVIRELFLSV